MASAVNHGFLSGRCAAVQCRNALGRIQFVTADGQIVHGDILNVDLQFPGSLDPIYMHQCVVCFRARADPGNGKITPVLRNICHHAVRDRFGRIMSEVNGAHWHRLKR